MTLALSYVGFLSIFVVLPVLGLSGYVASRPWSAVDRRLLAGTALIAGVALAYTTPWDNALLARGVWTYGENRVAARLWHAPVEEYLFVLGQTALVGLWTVTRAVTVRPAIRQDRRDALLGVAAGVAVGVAGLALLSGRTFYLGAILAWAGPVLALQWAVGWRYLWAVRRRLAVTVVVPATYLAAVDAFAIADGIWTISRATATGVAIAGLPIEEALFFLATTLFVVQGLVLLPWVLDRWGDRL